MFNGDAASLAHRLVGAAEFERAGRDEEQVGCAGDEPRRLDWILELSLSCMSAFAENSSSPISPFTYATSSSGANDVETMGLLPRNERTHTMVVSAGARVAAQLQTKAHACSSLRKRRFSYSTSSTPSFKPTRMFFQPQLRQFQREDV